MPAKVSSRGMTAAASRTPQECGVPDPFPVARHRVGGKSALHGASRQVSFSSERFNEDLNPGRSKIVGAGERRALTLFGLAICALPTLHADALAGEMACKFVSQLPDDCLSAQLRKYDSLRNYRFEEIDLFARDAIRKVLYVSSYNTTGLNGGDEGENSAPEPLVRSLDQIGR